MHHIVYQIKFILTTALVINSKTQTLPSAILYATTLTIKEKIPTTVAFGKRPIQYKRMYVNIGAKHTRALPLSDSTLHMVHAAHMFPLHNIFIGIRDTRATISKQSILSVLTKLNPNKQAIQKTSHHYYTRQTHTRHTNVQCGSDLNDVCQRKKNNWW